MVCTTCRSKIKNDSCPFDRSPIAYTRNRVIEKLLESVKSVSCKNAEYGCNEMLGYLEKNDHEKACKHSPCSCPLSGCDFLGSSSQLYQHFRAQHQNSSVLFRYDQDFSIRLDAKNDKFLVLLEGRDDNILFVLHNARSNQQQNGLSISCISSSREARNEYKISVSFGSNNVSTLTFRSAISSSKKQLDNLPKLGFPLVPWLLDATDGRLNLKICIFKDRLPHWLR